jgi:hypothetical protein
VLARARGWRRLMTDPQARIVEGVRSGCSIDEAARAADVAVGTARRWLTAGRKAPDGPHGEFARLLDGARADRRVAERALDGPLSAEEAELLLAKAARKGSVPALRLWFEMRSRDEAGQRGGDARRLIAEVFGEGDARERG